MQMTSLKTKPLSSSTEKKLHVSITRAFESSYRTGKLSIENYTGRFNNIYPHDKLIIDSIKRLRGTDDVANSTASTGTRDFSGLHDAMLILLSSLLTIIRTEAPVMKA